MIGRDDYIEEDFSLEQEDNLIDERDDDYARRIRAEIRHIENEEDEDEEEYIRDIEESEEDEEVDEEEEQREPSKPHKRPSWIWLVVSGNILIRDGLQRYYGQMALIAALFLLSIIVMFWSLHLDMEYNILSRDVQLLRERSVRLQEVRFSRTSHSSIVDELERRGINLVDPSEPATIIEKRLW